MGLFKSKPEKVLDAIQADYAMRMRSVWEQLPAMYKQPVGVGARQEMAKYHSAHLTNACRRALKAKGMAPEPETLSDTYWILTCSAYNLGNPFDTPRPGDLRLPQPAGEPLTPEQEQMYRDAYDKAFDYWMVVRIKNGSDAPKDFAGADFYAYTEASTPLRDAGVRLLEEQESALRAEQYAACVERLGYTDKLPHPLPTMGG